MKNYNSKENKYTNIKSLSILERAKHCQHLHSEGMSVKDIAIHFNVTRRTIYKKLANEKGDCYAS